MLTACKDELPNPHRNCVREILNALICHDNDMRRLNVELRNLKMEYKAEMDRIEFRCKELRKPVCESTDELKSFTQKIRTIDEVNECFNAKTAELKKSREEIIVAARQCFSELNAEKCKLKQFHEKTVDYLKRYAIKAIDPQVIKNCENDICEMHKQFVKEVLYIKKCENELLPFIQMCSLQDFCHCCCFKEYEWLPLGTNLSGVNNISDEIKCTMGTTLTKAFAQLHLHQPPDLQNFVASYLMNIEHNEDVLKEKLTLFGTFGH